MRERCGAESGTWLSGGLCEVGKMIGVMSRVPVGVYWEWGGEGQPGEGRDSLGRVSRVGRRPRMNRESAEPHENQKKAGRWGRDLEREGEAGQVVVGPDPVS